MSSTDDLSVQTVVYKESPTVKTNSKRSFWSRRISKLPKRAPGSLNGSSQSTNSQDVESGYSASTITITLDDNWEDNWEEETWESSRQGSSIATRKGQSICCTYTCGLPFEAQECVDSLFKRGGSDGRDDDNGRVQDGSKVADSSPRQIVPSVSSLKQDTWSVSGETKNAVNDAWSLWSRLSGSVVDVFTNLRSGMSANCVPPNQNPIHSTITTVASSIAKAPTQSEPIQVPPITKESKSQALPGNKESSNLPSAQKTTTPKWSRSRQPGSLRSIMLKNKMKRSRSHQTTAQNRKKLVAESREDVQSDLVEWLQGIMERRDEPEEAVAAEKSNNIEVGAQQGGSGTSSNVTLNKSSNEQERKCLKVGEQKKRSIITRGLGSALHRSFRRKSRKSFESTRQRNIERRSLKSIVVDEIQSAEKEIHGGKGGDTSPSMPNSSSHDGNDSGMKGGALSPVYEQAEIWTGDENKGFGSIEAATLPSKSGTYGVDQSEGHSVNRDNSNHLSEGKEMTLLESSKIYNSPTRESSNCLDESSLAASNSRLSRPGCTEEKIKKLSATIDLQQDTVDIRVLQTPLDDFAEEIESPVPSKVVLRDDVNKVGQQALTERIFDGNLSGTLSDDEQQSPEVSHELSSDVAKMSSTISSLQITPTKSNSFNEHEVFGTEERLAVIQEDDASDKTFDHHEELGIRTESFFGLTDQPTETQVVPESKPGIFASWQSIFDNACISLLSWGEIFARECSKPVAELEPALSKTATETETLPEEFTSDTVLDLPTSNREVELRVNTVLSDSKDDGSHYSSCLDGLNGKDPGEEVTGMRSFVDKLFSRDLSKTMPRDQSSKNGDSENIEAQASQTLSISASHSTIDNTMNRDVPQYSKSSVNEEIVEARPLTDELYSRNSPNESTNTPVVHLKYDPENSFQDTFGQFGDDVNRDTAEAEIGTSQTLPVSASHSTINNTTSEDAPRLVESSFGRRFTKTRSLPVRLRLRTSPLKSMNTPVQLQPNDEPKNSTKHEEVDQNGDDVNTDDADIDVQVSQTPPVSARHSTINSTTSEDAPQSVESSFGERFTKTRSLPGRLLSRIYSLKSTNTPVLQHTDEPENSTKHEIVDQIEDDVNTDGADIDSQVSQTLSVSASHSTINNSNDVLQSEISFDGGIIKVKSLPGTLLSRGSPKKTANTAAALKSQDEPDCSMTHEANSASCSAYVVENSVEEIEVSAMPLIFSRESPKPRTSDVPFLRTADDQIEVFPTLSFSASETTDGKPETRSLTDNVQFCNTSESKPSITLEASLEDNIEKSSRLEPIDGPFQPEISSCNDKEIEVSTDKSQIPAESMSITCPPPLHPNTGKTNGKSDRGCSCPFRFSFHVTCCSTHCHSIMSVV